MLYREEVGGGAGADERSTVDDDVAGDVHAKEEKRTGQLKNEDDTRADETESPWDKNRIFSPSFSLYFLSLCSTII